MTSITLQPGQQCEHPNLPGVTLNNPSDQTIVLSDFSEDGFSASIEPPPPTRLDISKKLTGANIAGLPAGTPYKKVLRDARGQVVGMCDAVTPTLMRPKRKTSQREDNSRLGRRLR